MKPFEADAAHPERRAALAGEEVDRGAEAEGDPRLQFGGVGVDPQLLLRGAEAEDQQIGLSGGDGGEDFFILGRVFLEAERRRERADDFDMGPASGDVCSGAFGDAGRRRAGTPERRLVLLGSAFARLKRAGARSLPATLREAPGRVVARPESRAARRQDERASAYDGAARRSSGTSPCDRRSASPHTGKACSRGVRHQSRIVLMVALRHVERVDRHAEQVDLGAGFHERHSLFRQRTWLEGLCQGAVKFKKLTAKEAKGRRLTTKTQRH